MSDATKDALEAALEAHMTDEHDEMVLLNGYILQASGSILSDDRQALQFDCKGDQSGITSLGLLAYMNYNVEGSMFSGDDDDD